MLPALRFGAVLADVIVPGVLEYTIGQNTSFAHSVPLFVNLVHDALLKNTTGALTASIEVMNEPLPSTLYEQVTALRAQTVSMIHSILLHYCRCLLCAEEFY